MNKDLTQRVTGTWETTLCATSNYSLIEAVMNVNKDHLAGIMRLFEFEVEKTAENAPGKISVGVAQRIFSRLKESHGNTGLIYAQFLGKNHERVRKEVAHTFDSIVSKHTILQEERYWAAAMAVILSGAMYSNELKFTKIDLNQLENFLGTTLEKLRANVKDAPVDMHNSDAISNQLQQFLNAMASRHTLRTSRIHVGQGKPTKGSIQILNDISRLEGIYVQYGRDDNLLRISKSYLSRWLDDHKYPKQAFMRALQESFGFRQINGFIGAGTDRVGGAREYILEANVTDKSNTSYLNG